MCDGSDIVYNIQWLAPTTTFSSSDGVVGLC